MELFKLFGTLGLNGVKETENQLDDVTNKAEDSSNKMVGFFKKVGAAVATYFAVDKIKDFGVAVVKASAEVQAEEAAFTQIMGAYADQAAEKVSKIAEATGMVDSRLTPYMTSMTAKFKGLGYDVEEATDLASVGLNIAADAAAFWDKSLTDSMGALNSFVNGNYEGGEAIGLFANETTLATWASQNLNLEWKNLTEKEKQFARLQFAKSMQEASGATGQASKESGAYANVMGNLSEAWRQFKAEVGEPLLQNVVIPAIQWLGTFINDTLIPGFTNLKTWVIENKATLMEWGNYILTATGVVAGFVAVLKTSQIISGIVSSFQAANKAIADYIIKVYAASSAGMVSNATLSAKNIILGVLSGQIGITTAATMLWQKAQNKLNASLLANPITWIVALIAGLVAILVTAYNKNEDFRNAVNALWKELKEALGPAIESLKPLISSIIDLFKQVWSLIKTLVIPIFNSIISVITKILQVVTPIISKLASLFAEQFGVIINVVTTVINVIGKIIGAITKAVNAVKDGINKIKGFFNFKFEWPKLKMPKFAITPSGWKIGDLLKGSIPKLGIKWNAEGAIFDEPTIFPTAHGLQGVGEAGAEAVAPIDKLMGYVQTAVQQETSGTNYLLERLINMLATFFPEILNNLKRDIVFPDGVLAARLAPQINIKLAEIQEANRRGR